MIREAPAGNAGASFRHHPPLTGSVHGAKTQLSKLLDLVEDGESVVIERHGRPVAQLVPVRERRVSPLGAC